MFKCELSFLTLIYLLAKEKEFADNDLLWKMHEKSVNELNRLLFPQEYILSRLGFLKYFSLFLLNKLNFVLIKSYEVLQIFID